MNGKHSTIHTPKRASAPTFQELSPEQTAFARMLGDLLARRWAESLAKPIDGSSSAQSLRGGNDSAP